MCLRAQVKMHVSATPLATHFAQRYAVLIILLLLLLLLVFWAFGLPPLVAAA